MYIEIVEKLKDIFEGIVIHEVEGGTDLTLDVYPYPLEEGKYPTKYPAVVFFPSNYSNDFSSNKTNFKILEFKAVLMMETQGLTSEQLFTYTLPNALDKIVKEIDGEWDLGRVDGKRVWARNSAGVWGKYADDNGEKAFVDMTILIKLETSNN